MADRGERKESPSLQKLLTFCWLERSYAGFNWITNNTTTNNNNNEHLSCAHQRPERSMIHINLNMIFYTHVQHSPTKTIYIKYYLK